MPSIDPENQQRVQALLAQCEAALSNQNYEDVIGNCTEILSLDPDNVRAKEMMEEAQSKMEADVFVRENLKRAQDFLQNRDFQKCISECQKIQLLDPDNQLVANLMSKAQEKMEAEPFIQNFVSSGQSLFDSGLFGEAVSQWEKVRSIDPQYPALDSMIRTAKDKMSGSSAAPDIPLFDLGGDGGTSDIPLLGFEELSMGSMEAPSAPVESGPLSDEDRIKQLLREGDDLYNQEQYQRAIEVWSEIFMLDVNHPEALQKIEEAKAASSDQQTQVKNLLTQGQAAYEEGNTDEARTFFERVVALDSNNSEAKKYLARMGDRDKAPNSLEELIALGDTAEENGKFREAAQYLSQALAIDSDNAALADRVKNLNVLAKKHEQAKVLFGNAKAFLAEGKADSARHALAKLLESDPGNQEALDLMREVKRVEASNPAGSMAVPRPASRPATAGKKLPIIPVAIAAGVILLLAAGGYWVMSHKKNTVDSSPIPTPKTVKKTLHPAQPPPATQTSQTSTQVEITPEAREKAIRAVQEATFYYQAKHLVEAQGKILEALSLDPQNRDAKALKIQVDNAITEQVAQEKKMLTDANSYFTYSEFAGAVELYEKYMEKHPESKSQIQPQIVKCYYNLGVLAVRTYNCDRAADYFRQVLFIDDTDQLSKDALAVARQCQKTGTGDIEVRKAVSLMEMRK